MLNAIHHGEGHPENLLICHGLYGSARNWGVIAKRLSDIRNVTCVDMRNHGNSPWFESHSYPDMAQDLTDFADGDVLGHSMGGKAAMTLALTHPDRVRRLIVADIAPVSYTHSQLENIHAMRAVDLSKVAKRSDAKALLDVDPDIQDFLLQSLDVAGKKWRLNMDVLEREMPKVLSFPDLEGQFDGPTLFLSGAESDYVKPEHRDRIKSMFPKARFAKIPGAGHWLHAQKPREFEATARAFLTA